MSEIAIQNLIVLAIVSILLVWTVRTLTTQGAKQADIYVQAIGQNKALLDLVEVVGKSAPPEIIAGLLGVTQGLIALLGNNPDLAQLLKDVADVAKKVTDGQPNG